MTSFHDLGFGDQYDVTTPAGRETRYQSANMGRLAGIVRVTNASTGAGYTTTVDSNGTPGKVVITNGNGKATTYTPTSNQITQVVDPLGHVQSTTYNPDSDPTNLTNGLTQITTLGWDLNDNLTSLTEPASKSGQTPAAQSLSYQTPVSGGGAVTNGQYLPSSQTDGEGNCTAYTYDAAGNRTASYNGLPASGTTPNCDGQTTGPGVASTLTAYQGDGATTCGAKTGEVCTTTTGAGNQTTYSYASTGNLSSIDPPFGNCATGSRNLCTTFTYDGDSRPLTVTDGKNQATSYTYNKFDQITQILYNGAASCTYTTGNCLTYAYDADGNVTARTDQTGATAFAYDTLGSLTNEALPAGANACSGTNPPSIAYGYDAASNLTSYCDAGGTVTYGYDPANRMIGVATGSGSCAYQAVTQPCTVYTYNAASQLTSLVYPTSTGVTDTLTPDNAGNTTKVAYTGGNITGAATYTYGYTTGTNDRPLIQSAAATTAGTTVTTTYGYSTLDQLTSATTGNAATNDTYNYDADGNLTSETLGGATHTMAYTAADALCWALAGTSANPCSTPPAGAVTYHYDNNGNQQSSSAGETNTYNPANQTASMTSPTGGTAVPMAYTGTDNTQRTAAGTTTLTNNTFGVASSTTGGTTSYVTRDPSGRLNSLTLGTTRYYYLYDGTSNITGLINTSGAQVANYTYDPYGNTTGTGALAATNPYRYAAGYTDGTGYTKFGARYYNSTLGGWTQLDPSRKTQATYTPERTQSIGRIQQATASSEMSSLGWGQSARQPG